MNRRTATWLGGTGSTLSHLDQDVRLRLRSKNNNPFGRESSQSSFLVPEDERFVGTGFIGGTPSPQQLLRQIPGRRHPQPVSELLVPGIKEPAAFFPSASAQILRHSRRIDDLQGQIEEERLEYRRLDAALRERLAAEEQASGSAALLHRSSSLGSLSSPSAIGPGTSSPPRHAPLRAITDSGLSPSLSRTQLLGPMAIRGASFGRTETHRPALTLTERRMADAASIAPSEPRDVTHASAHAAALRAVNDRGVGIQYRPSQLPPWDMRPRDKPLRGFSGIVGI